jgi:hypothetical protein
MLLRFRLLQKVQRFFKKKKIIFFDDLEFYFCIKCYNNQTGTTLEICLIDKWTKSFAILLDYKLIYKRIHTHTHTKLSFLTDIFESRAEAEIYGSMSFSL